MKLKAAIVFIVAGAGRRRQRDKVKTSKFQIGADPLDWAANKSGAGASRSQTKLRRGRISRRAIEFGSGSAKLTAQSRPGAPPAAIGRDEERRSSLGPPSRALKRQPPAAGFVTSTAAAAAAASN